jgi:hypothetical protein
MDDCEGNQKVVYTIVVRDSGDASQTQEIIPASIEISVPTRYGISAQLLYPLSGIAAFVGALIALPVWNVLVKDLLRRRRKRKEQPKLLIAKK